MFLSHDIPIYILEEISYKLVSKGVPEGEYLIRTGQIAEEIYLIVEGEFDVIIENNKKETVIDSLYQGCSVGAYSILHHNPHTISLKAKFDSTVLVLEIDTLERLKEKHSELTHYMHQYEDYINTWGLPYCDYSIYRHRKTKVTAMEKFRVGIHRILKIKEATKSDLHINDLLGRIQEQILAEQQEKKNRRRKSRNGQGIGVSDERIS